ncbi:hypothetical protein B0H12DRAFT_589878 [Mycena haematopus]|nr:hypothetical protein B0H12DRAFT_589878 [Mycena haematopus]
MKLYRCVTIWGPSPYTRAVTGVPLLLILSTAGVGLWGTFSVKSDSPIPFAMALLTNFVLFSLTAGRVWRKGRQITVVLGAEAGKRYNTTLRILCESSLLYFVNMLLYLISSVVGPLSLLAGIAWGALAQVVNIVPMMIMVRAGMGRDTNPDRLYDDNTSSRFGMTQILDITAPVYRERHNEYQT